MSRALALDDDELAVAIALRNDDPPEVGAQGNPQKHECFCCKYVFRTEDEAIWDMNGTCAIWAYYCGDREACEKRMRGEEI